MHLLLLFTSYIVYIWSVMACILHMSLLQCDALYTLALYRNTEILLRLRYGSYDSSYGTYGYYGLTMAFITDATRQHFCDAL